VKTGSKLAESSKEGYRSKRAVLPMMMMMTGIINLVSLCDTDKDI
jgi:hypothetical protein